MYVCMYIYIYTYIYIYICRVKARMVEHGIWAEWC